MSKKHVLCLALVAMMAASSFAQKSPFKFGNIPAEDLKMTIYSKDSSAVAFRLVDYGQAYLAVTGGTIGLNIDYHVRIKILKKEGLSYADAAIRLLNVGGREERMSGLKASTFNLENGKVVESKVEKDGIFKENVNRNYTIMKFTFPNAKEGSVLDYTYHITSEFYTLFPNWRFQARIPVRHSEYWALVPEILTYEKYLQGYIPIDFQQSTQDYMGGPVQAFHWTAKDVPAFKEEPYMTSEEDFISRINFALSYVNYSTHSEEVMGTWEKLAETLNKASDFGDVINGGGFLKDVVAQVTAGITDPAKKAEAIVNYVKKNIEWDGESDFYASPLKKVVEKRKGTVGDINLLLACMLDKAGLEMDMVLVSTRDHGFVRQQYPMARQFNYVLCAIYLGDKVQFLDATDRYLPWNAIPKRCLNGEGLLVSPKRRGWVEVANKVRPRSVVSATLAIDGEGVLKGSLEYSRDGYAARDQREVLNTKSEEDYLKDVKSGRNWTIEKSSFENAKENDKTLKETYQLTIAEHSNVANDIVYVNPFVDSRMEENPFKEEKRVYPINYGSPFDDIYMAKITVPDGYTVDELPKSKVLALPGNAGRYTYSVTQTGNVINILRNFQINKSLFIQDEYAVIREFYNQVIAKEEEQIVIKKK